MRFSFVVPDHCAKTKCAGGKCVNELSGAVCSCGDFQRYDNRLKKCVPDNCGTRPGKCGTSSEKGTCEDTSHGPRCICLRADYIYYPHIKKCKADFCKLGHCGSETVSYTHLTLPTKA